MKDLKVGIIQTTIYWEDIAANLAMLEEKIWQFTEPLDLIVLPEMFSTGFTMNAPALAETMNGHTFRWMVQLASQTGAVITGSYIIKENFKFYNRLFWVYPDGSSDFYNKKHLFAYGGEDKVYEPGTNRMIKGLKGWKICPMICYDLRFPIWSRNKILENQNYEYDLLIYVANWPASRIDAWKTLLKARAIENSSYTLGVNILGKDGRGLIYEGESKAFAPLEDVFDAGAESNINIITFSFEKLKDYRTKFPFLADDDRFSIES